MCKHDFAVAGKKCKVFITDSVRLILVLAVCLLCYGLISWATPTAFGSIGRPNTDVASISGVWDLLDEGVRLLNSDQQRQAAAAARKAIDLIEMLPSEDAEVLAASAKAHGLLASVYFIRNMKNAALKEWQEAVDLLKEAGRDHDLFPLETAPTDAPDIISTRAKGRSLLAMVYFKRGMRNAALKEWQKAVELLELSKGDQPLYLENLKNIGAVLIEQKRPAEALNPLFKLLNTYKQIPSSPEVKEKLELIHDDIDRLLKRIDNDRREHRWNKETITTLKKSLSIIRSLNRPYGYILMRSKIHGLLGELLAMAGEPAEAVQHLHHATRLTWEAAVPVLTKTTYWISYQMIDSSFDKVQPLYSLTFKYRDIVDPLLGFETSLLTTALFSEISRASHGILFGQAAGIDDSQRQLVELRRQVARRVLTSPKKLGEDSNVLQNLARNLNDLEKTIRDKRMGSITVMGPNTMYKQRLVTAREVAMQLQPGDLLVQYVGYEPIAYPQLEKKEERLGVFVLSADSSVSAVDLGPISKINVAIEEFRAWRAQLDLNEAKFAESGAKLRELVLDPIGRLNGKESKGIRRLYIVTDREVSLIPFEALPRSIIGKQLRYLVEDFEIVYLISARDLVRFSKKESVKTSQEAWLVGDPAFNADPTIRLEAITRGAPEKWLFPSNRLSASESKELPMTRSLTKKSLHRIRTYRERLPRTRLLLKEAAMQVGRAGMRPRILVDEFASEELVQYIHSPRLLLFATHGDFLEGAATPGPGFPFFIRGDAPRYAPGFAEATDPLMRSVLVLAGVNNSDDVVTRYYVNGEVLSENQARSLGMTEEQLKVARFELGDGLLTAYEIWAMDLANTELVVVIGCETGLGAVTGTKDGNPPVYGEAVSGLRQAFAVAGARSMVMSMWEVDEKQTIEQMGSFLEYWLSKKKPRFRAFYRAQLDALKRARTKRGNGHPFWWAGFVYIGDPHDRK